MRLELVKDWMSRDVVTVTPDMSLPEASALMTVHKIRRLPVLVNGRLAGIVTYGDIRGARPSSVHDLDVAELSYLLSQLTIAQIMTANPMTVAPEATIGDAAQIMLAHAIGALPVIDADRELVGIITESDIFRLVVHEWSGSKGNPPEPYAHYGA